MSNTERPVIEWLNTIADPIVRESAIRQCTNPYVIVSRLAGAIENFVDLWANTKEGRSYWGKIWISARDGELPTVEIPIIDPATIAPAATDWMDEVHTMD